MAQTTDRRSHARVPGKFNDALDVAFKVMRQHEANAAISKPIDNLDRGTLLEANTCKKTNSSERGFTHAIFERS